MSLWKIRSFDSCPIVFRACEYGVRCCYILAFSLYFLFIAIPEPRPELSR